MEQANALQPATIAGLQDLIEIAIDSADGYRAAAEHLALDTVRSGFLDIAAQRQRFADELAEYVQANAEHPRNRGSWKAQVHRWWLELRAGLSDDELGVVLDEAERGEAALAGVYEKVIRRTSGSPVNDVLHRQLALIHEARKRLRLLRQELSEAG